VRVLVTRVLRYVSNKFGISTAFRFRVNLTYGADGRDAILYRPDTCVLWPLGGAATTRALCWCFALCEDSGVQCSLYYFSELWTAVAQI